MGQRSVVVPAFFVFGSIWHSEFAGTMAFLLSKTKQLMYEAEYSNVACKQWFVLEVVTAPRARITKKQLGALTSFFGKFVGQL